MFLANLLVPVVRTVWFTIVTHLENSTCKNFAAEAISDWHLQLALGRSGTELGRGHG
jgi:lysophospholipid acyltransferase (LPLAT)-like uncharacterized protein